MASEKPRILHCLPTGGDLIALAETIAVLTFEARHEVAFAEEHTSYDKALLRSSGIQIARDFPSLAGRPSPGRLIAIGQSMSGYDLVLTYGWETVNAAMAHRVFGQHLTLPPLIHHEAGYAGLAEQERSFKRKVLRRLALATVHTLVSDCRELISFAATNWAMPRSRIAYVPQGLDLKRYRPIAKPDALPGLVKRNKESWLGAFLSEHSLDEAQKLVGVLKELPRDWQLVFIGGERQANALRSNAEKHQLSHRVHFLDASTDEAKALALLDVYVEIGDPFEPVHAARKAMAAGNVIAAALGSEAAEIASGPNRELLSANVADSLERIIEDAPAREAAGKANREKALTKFDKSSFGKALSAVYQAALGA